ncbi:MAG: acyltransferase family protein, partial [Akkermansiaceae bacterium]
MNINHSLQYRPDIDGLRALAVLPVVLFHANLGFPGGFVGVDVFFVISGFLITSIIARDIKKGTFSMPYFWERRIRRIFPAAAVLTLVTLIAGAFILLPGQLEDLGKASVAQMFMVSNFYFWQQDGYFAGPSDFEPILHTWSLAVEEQFYFIFPILLVLLYKKISSSGVIRSLLMVLLLASLALSIYGVHHFPTPTFYLLPA